jgi:hypothetical protein
MIVNIKPMNRDHVFFSTRNMKNTTKVQWAVRSGNYRCTNTINVHTCAISSPDLGMVVIPIVHGQFIEPVGDMIGCAGVEVQAGIIPM